MRQLTVVLCIFATAICASASEDELAGSVVFTDEWVAVLKENVRPDLSRSFAALALATEPGAARLRAAVASLGPRNSTTEPMPSRKQLIKNNLQEWYASELAKPYGTAREVEHWQSLRLQNYGERLLLIKLNESEVLSSWKNLQRAAGLLALPKVPFEP